MRIALADDSRRRIWAGAESPFHALADSLRRAGHEVVTIDAAAQQGGRILAGAVNESDVIDLIGAARLVEPVLRAGADLTLFPLRGGLGHGALMARACGEIPAERRIALWGDAPTRTLFLRGDPAGESLRPLVADALERACLELADALVVPDENRLREIAGICAAPPPVHCAALPLNAGGGAGGVSTPVGTIAFVGPFDRASGVTLFIDAMERLCAKGLLEGREVIFAGPIGNGAYQPGKDWLGLRAARFGFRFRAADARGAAQLMELCAKPECLPVVLAGDPSEIPAPLQARALVLPIGEPRETIAAIETRVAGALGGGPAAAARRAGDWAGLLEKIAEAPPRHRAPPNQSCSLSVCILHYERPKLLERAVASVEQEKSEGPLEIIVLDNASRSQEARAALDRLEAAGVKTVRLDEPKPFGAAYNHAARFARHEFLALMDDDNLFTSGGRARLARACATGRFDVITSNLEVIEGEEGAPSAERIAFIGAGRSAGLFFNAFGDTCMVFRREAFLRIGGFPETGGAFPAADWALLARAQAQGLEIGVLQEPAFQYRRHEGHVGPNWQKYDQYGARAHVMREYGGAFDPELLAKFAQGLWLCAR